MPNTSLYIAFYHLFLSLFLQTLKDWHLLIGVGVITSVAFLILIIGESIPETRHVPTLVVDGETGSTTNVSYLAADSLYKF